MMISVTILTRNSERYLEKVLQSLREFDEVLILDSGSEDRTQAIAQRFPNVSWHRETFKGFGPMHNRASELARHDWIFSIDSDEVASVSLVSHIKHADLNPTWVYSCPRRNFFNGKWIRYCGWYPDRVLRLYHRKHTRWSDAQVHESVQTDGMRVCSLEWPIYHYSYGSISDFLTKMQLYSDLFVVQNKGQKPSSLCKAVLHGAYAFIKSYLLQRGFLDGREGFVISAYNGMTCYHKYLKLWESSQEPNDTCAPSP